MCENDSFSDLDDICSFYSFKNVTKTYKDQLNKLMSNNAFSIENNFNLENDISKNTNNGSHLREDSSGVDATKASDSVEVIYVKDSASNDSVNILEVEATPNRALRRSGRLKNKKNAAVKKSPIILDIVEAKSFSPGKTKNNRKKKKKNKPEEITINDAEESPVSNTEDVNPQLQIKVVWKSTRIKKFLIRKYQKMSHIYQELSIQENVPENRIILTLNKAKVNHCDTPASLNLQKFDFLEGGILTELTFDNNSKSSDESNPNDKNAIVLKFQDSDKKVIKVAVNKCDKMKIAMVKYSEQIETHLGNIKFLLDGETFNPTETPISLGLENDDIIDVRIIRH